MSANTRQEDFLFAEHVLRRGFATEEQVQQCLRLLERMRGELELDETLENILLKKGYLAQAQAQVIQSDINPEAAGAAKNQIEGYQLLVRLGSGAMGSVYKAHHQKLNIPVALKVLRVDLAKSKTQIERLKREAQLAARLNHPNIVGSLDVGESNGFHYFAMEYVDGQTVRQVLHRGRLREKEALRIMRDVASALEHAHQHGVIHRDIKPANIILTKTGKVKLADFGLARGKGPSDLTLDQASIGTPQYLAPEQARRGADATPRSDLFSLGASLYHMVTGRPPFSGENLGEIFQKVLHCEFDPPEAAVQDLSLDTVYLIHRLMRFHPRERYASATDLLVDLDRMAAGQRIAPAEFKGDYRKYLQRRRRRQGLIAAAAVLAIVAASVFTAKTFSAHREESARAEKCRTANLVGEGDLEQPSTVEDFKRLHKRMLNAAASGRCEPEEIKGLTRRIQLVQADIASLQAAEACKETARTEPGAHFQELLRKAGVLQLRIELGGARVLAQTIENEIRAASNKAVDERNRDIYNPGRYKTPEAALAALDGFERDLRDRYVDQGELRSAVARHAHALRTLIDEWTRAEKSYGPFYEKAAGEHKYDVARENLDFLIEAHKTARVQAQRAGINSDNFLGFFPETDDRDHTLRRRERDYFEDVVQAEADKQLTGKKKDPDEAERVVLKFKPHAWETRGRVASLIARIDQERKSIAERQGVEIATLGEMVRRALEDRQYGRAWQVVSEADARTDWMPAKRSELKPLVRETQYYRALRDRFVRNAAPGYRPAPGGDLDLFVTAAGEAVTLKQVKQKDLLKIMRFRDPDDTRLRGYFFLVESLATFNPLDRERFLGAAISDLNRAHDPLVVSLRERELEVKKTRAERERNAAAEHKAMLAAKERNDHVTALQLVNNLLEPYRNSLRYTEYAQQHRKALLKIRDALRLLVGVDLLRLRASLPKRNFEADPDSGVVKLTFDFEEWWPHEGQVARRLLPQKARDFWRNFFKAEGYPQNEWPVLLPRAMHQLLWFDDGHLVLDKQNGGARFHSKLSNVQLWKDRRDDELQAIVFDNPFSLDRDWSIELSVVWDIDELGKTRDWKKDDAEKNARDYAVPWYFALTAGQVQAGLAAAPWKFGGGGGARLFVEESLTRGVEKRMYDFHERLIGKRKFPVGSERAHIEVMKNRQGKPRARHMFHEGEPYRVRLERDGLTLRYSMIAEEVWKKRGGRFDPRDNPLVLNMKLSKREWDRGMRVGGRKVFRIFSLNPSRLLQVVLTGHVSTDE